MVDNVKLIVDIGLFLVAFISAVIAIGEWKQQQAEHNLQIVSGLTAWWVKKSSDDGDLWGVMVSNTSPLPFNTVKIQASGNFNKSATPISIAVLPPGRFFIKGLAAKNQYDWGFAEEISDDCRSDYSAILSSSVHQILSITFTDYLNKRWKWTPQLGLRKHSSTSS